MNSRSTEGGREWRQVTRDEGRNERWLKKSNVDRKRCARVCVFVYRSSECLFSGTRKEKFNCAERKKEREKERMRVMEEWRYRVVTYLLSSPSVKYYEGDSVIGTRVFVQFSNTPIKPFPICRTRSCNSTSNGIRVKNNRERLASR